jgi:hypothetical protein
VFDCLQKSTRPNAAALSPWAGRRIFSEVREIPGVATTALCNLAELF